MTKFRHVFSPLKIGNLTVKNRIEVAPTVACLATADGMVTAELIAYTQSLAGSGAGVVTIGDSVVDFEYAKDHEAQLNLGDDRILPGLSRLVYAIHRYGAKASIEINHGGRFSAPGLLQGRNPIGPSPIPSNAELMFAEQEGRRAVQVTEMTQDHMDMVIDRYVHAVFNCMQAGFEMVMLHGAHGHMLSQFVSPLSNKRTDLYGGSMENRARFPIQVLDAIRKKVGDRVAIEYRISATEIVPDGMQLEDTIEFVKMIQDKIDLLHVSVGLLTEPLEANAQMIQPTYLPHGLNVHWAEKIKKAVSVPVTAVGSIDMEMADNIIREGKADMVAMARNIIADSGYVNKMRRGEYDDVRPCVRCNTCTGNTAHFYPILCAVNPVVGREAEYRYIRPADKIKKVVIAGGGPAGMQAALTASSRGHKVTLYEKSEKLGGNLHLAASLPFKADMKNHLEWLIKQTMKAPVDVKLNTEATPGNIKAESPDVLIVAVGARPLIPDIPGINKTNAVWAGDVALGIVPVGDTVLVAGGGLTGCETALHLALQGKTVTIIDLVAEVDIAKDCPIINRLGLMQLIRENKVSFKTEVKLEEITDKGVKVIDKKWNRYEIPADTVVLSLGFEPLSEVADLFRDLAPDVYVIGDCQSPRNLKAAIHEGFNYAVEI